MSFKREGNHKRIGICGLPPLISAMVVDLVGNNLSAFEFDASGTVPELENMDCFVVGGGMFLTHIDFFLPRKAHVLIFISDISVPESVVGSDLNFFSHEDKPYTVREKLQGIIPAGEKSIGNELSPREIEVLVEVASGKINKEIAEKLNISVNTVISHRKNITSKLGIRSVSGLSVYALMNGLI